MGHSGPVVPRIIIFTGRDRDGLRVVPIQGRESQELRSGRHVGVVGRIVDGHDHVSLDVGPCGLESPAGLCRCQSPPSTASRWHYQLGHPHSERVMPRSECVVVCDLEDLTYVGGSGYTFIEGSFREW